MSHELSREQKWQSQLYETVPLYEVLGLQVDALGDTVRLSVPLQRTSANHFGAMHAGVLFTLAEAVAGVALLQYREMKGRILLATDIAIKYVRTARTTITGEVALAPDKLASSVAKLEANPKSDFMIDVVNRDSNGVVVATAVCTFQLR